MTPIFWITYAVLWLVVVSVAILVILLYRQFGLILMPGGRRISYGGLDIDSSVPVLALRVDGDANRVFDWTTAGERDYVATLALFAAPSCPICERLATDPAMTSMGTAYSSVRFIWIDGGREPSHQLPPPWTNAFSAHNDAHVAMEVPGTPFAYLVSPDGRVISKGLANSVGDIKSMITAGEIARELKTISAGNTQ
jgi:hypothetical protein